MMINPTTKPLVLVDGSSYFYRAFHALPPLTTSKGEPTGAIYGVANMIKRLIKDYAPELMVVVFDAKGKTFRDEWYPDYKAHRAPTPPELSQQFTPLTDLLTAMGIPLLTIEGVEADDVIGTLAHQASSQGVSVLISTGDKDMAQLVNEHVTLINTMSNQVLDPAGVQQKFGVMPDQMIDYLTLVGDSSDNIPGVNKCGPKTAVKWLTEYNHLDNLIAHSANIGGKIGESLRASIPQFDLTKKLVTIKKDVELPMTFHELNLKSPQHEKMLTLIRHFEFKTWLKELLSYNETSEENSRPQTEPSYTIINEKQAWEALLKKLETCSLMSIDTETTNLDAIKAELVGIALSIEPNAPFYIPFIHQENTPQLNRHEVLAALKPILESALIKKVGQNLKYDYLVFQNYDIHLQGIEFDTMLESYLLNSAGGRHDMDSLSLKYLGHKTISFKDVAGSGAKQLRFDQIPLAKAAPYAAEDADITLKLHQTLYPMLPEPVKHLLKTIEVPLLTVLATIERHGVLIDCQRLNSHGARLKETIQALEKEACELAGCVFNLSSPKQLQEVLYQVKQFPILAKTPTGQPSTAEPVLQELAYDYRLPAVILEYRSLTKLLSTYIEALPKCVNPTTGRVHTSYNQAIAATGRLSSSEPNLQNIPVRNEEGRLIRRAFIAPAHHVLVSADYSQIELRIMAHLSEDPTLLTAFANDWDIHSATASEIFSTPLESVTHEQRRRAKAINFGLIYGMSAFGLAKQLGIERHDAQYYIDQYFKRYPGVLAFMDRTRTQARELGYVETLFGRRLYLPEIQAQNMMRRKAAERAAINAPMQGTAADIIKKAMIDIDAWQNQHPELVFPMIMQVHDELVFEVPEANVDAVCQTVRTLMETCVNLAVPLRVSIGSGQNWDEAHT